MLVKSSPRVNTNQADFEDIPLKGFFIANGQHYIKLKNHCDCDNAYNTKTHQFHDFCATDNVDNLNEVMTATIPGIAFRDIQAGDHFIYEGNICTRSMSGSYYFIIANGESSYLSPETIVESADIIMLVNTDKTCNRFRESMMLLNTVWSVAQYKLPLIKALRVFGNDMGITFGLKEAKDWVEANCK